jgi:hypothetical protein
MTACAAPAQYTATRTRFGNAPSSPISDAVATVSASHYQVAVLDSTNGRFVALPTDETAPGVRTAMIVRVAVREARCGRRGKCIAGARTVVAVTPIAFSQGRELEPEQVPAEARHRADDLSWAILASIHH